MDYNEREQEKKYENEEEEEEEGDYETRIWEEKFYEIYSRFEFFV